MKIGKYEVLATVKTGSMATLYKALDPERKCEVALKGFECSGPEKARDFQREVRSRTTLTHASIEQIVALGDEGNLVYVATEWLEGEDIGHFVARRATLSLEEKLDFMLDICEGLVYAHESHVIHCDISPSKLFMLKSGAGKILDFGTSRFWSVQFCQAKPDRPPDIFSYRAPEQIIGDPYDPRTDVFSAGLVFFEFLTGARLYAQMLGAGIGIGDSGSRPVHVAGLPDSLMKSLQKAIAVEPAARYQSMSEMRTSLRTVRDEVTRQRVELAKQIQSDCGLISPLLAKLKDVLDSNWFQKRLNEAGVDSKLLEQIQSDSSAGFASGLQYIGIVSLTDELEKAGIFLTEIDKEIDAQRQNILALRSVLPEIRADLARELLDNSGDLFSSDPEVKSAMEEIRVQLRINALSQAIREQDLALASRLLEEIECAPPAQESAARSVAAAKAELADISAKAEALFKNVEVGVDQLHSAVRLEDAERIQGQLENLQYQEKRLESQYPSSDLVAKLIKRSRETRYQGWLILLQHECTEAIKDLNVPVAKEMLRQFEILCGSRPDCAATLAQLRVAVARLGEQPARKPLQTKLKPEVPEDEKQSLVIGQPSIRWEQRPKREERAIAQEGSRASIETQPVKEGKARLVDTCPPDRMDIEIKNERKSSAEEDAPASADQQKANLTDNLSHIHLGPQPKKEGRNAAKGAQTEPKQPPTEDTTSVKDKRPGESGVKDEVDLEVVRTLVANLFEENPERCLAFLDTLESQLIEDPIIQSCQQKALEARKERGAEITLTKPKRRADLETQDRWVACPVCSTPNPVGSKYCSQCHALIQEAKAVEAEPDPGIKPIPMPTATQAKQRLRSPAASTTILRPKQAPGHGTAKYYGIALLALIAVGVPGWFLYNKYIDSGSTAGSVPEIIGAAETAVEAELRDGMTIVANLPRGTQLDVLQQPGASSHLVQDPDSLLLVSTKQGIGGKQPLSGSIKARYLNQLEIKTDKAYTGWHALWVALDRFPDTERTNPSDLKLHLESVKRQIEAHPEVVPPPELIKKQAVGYLSLARRSANREDTGTGCKNAAHYKRILAPGEAQMLDATYEALCTPQTATPPKSTCDKVLGKMVAKLNKAGDLISNDEFFTADKILQQVLKMEPCNDEVRKLLKKAEERHKLCLKKLNRGKKK